MPETDVTVVPIKDGDEPIVKNDDIAASFQDGKVTDDGMQSIQVGVDNVDDPAQKKMADKADAGTGNEVLLAGKYKTQEDLEKGTMEALSKKHGDDRGKAFSELGELLTKHQGNYEEAYKELAGNLKAEGDAQTDNTDAASNTDDKATTDKDTDKDVNKDIDKDTDDDVDTGDLTPHMDQFTQEYGKDGKLSDDSYEKLEKAGYDRPMVDTYLKGIEAIQSELMDKVGGKENFTTMQQWAGENLNEADIALFNEDMNSGNLAKMGRAVDTLHARYKTEVGGFAPQKRIVPEDGSGATGETGYQSIEQMKKDMRDSRYQKDPAFREQVKNKLKVTTAF